jgi:hypothetical protein
MPSEEIDMTNKPIFTDWTPQTPALFSNVPLRLKHSLHEHPLFSDAGLIRLLEACPRDNYNLVQWGTHGARSTWREGEIAGLSGADVLEAIRLGRMWINIRNLPQFSAEHAELLRDVFGEMTGRIPGFETFNHTMGVLISSPMSRTLYHADLPGQSLWQLRGRKRVYLYPKAPPFLKEEQLEQIALTGIEVSLDYQSWFEDHAQVFDIEPGDMMTWPHNMPHRVDNHDMLNVSMTAEWFTPEIRRAHIVTVANAILRHKLGVTPRSRETNGASFYAKAALQKFMRNTPWVRQEKRARKAATFRPDPNQPNGIRDITGATA